MHRIPGRLKHIVPKASGSDRFECWKMGEGPFQPGPVGDGLTLRPDKPYHGVVEPSSPMTAQEYQDLLAATRDRWVIEVETRP